jgi:large subunit ribosomal protein L7/L12
VIVAAAPADGGPAAAAPEKTDFDVVLTSFGQNKLNVVKIVKNITGASLMDAKKLVDAAPATLKQAVPKAEAEKMKAELEEAGATVELK